MSPTLRKNFELLATKKEDYCINRLNCKHKNAYMKQAIYILFACLAAVSVPLAAQENDSDAIWGYVELGRSLKHI